MVSCGSYLGEKQAHGGHQRRAREVKLTVEHRKLVSWSMTVRNCCCCADRRSVGTNRFSVGGLLNLLVARFHLRRSDELRLASVFIPCASTNIKYVSHRTWNISRGNTSTTYYAYTQAHKTSYTRQSRAGQWQHKHKKTRVHASTQGTLHAAIENCFVCISGMCYKSIKSPIYRHYSGCRNYWE